MLLKRWGTFTLLLMFVLSACGTADTSDIARDESRVAHSTTPDAPYPPPLTEEPSLTNTPTVKPTIASKPEPTNQPTILE